VLIHVFHPDGKGWVIVPLPLNEVDLESQTVIGAFYADRICSLRTFAEILLNGAAA
jgi:hypothetical protein